MSEKRGGVRLGAGRPKSEPTKMVRVPLGAEPIVKSFLVEYKNLSADDVEFFNECSSRASIRLVELGFDTSIPTLTLLQILNPQVAGHARLLVRFFESINKPGH